MGNGRDAKIVVELAMNKFHIFKLVLSVSNLVIYLL